MPHAELLLSRNVNAKDFFISPKPVPDLDTVTLTLADLFINLLEGPGLFVLFRIQFRWLGVVVRLASRGVEAVTVLQFSSVFLSQS